MRHLVVTLLVLLSGYWHQANAEWCAAGVHNMLPWANGKGFVGTNYAGRDWPSLAAAQGFTVDNDPSGCTSDNPCILAWQPNQCGATMSGGATYGHVAVFYGQPSSSQVDIADSNGFCGGNRTRCTKTLSCSLGDGALNIIHPKDRAGTVNLSSFMVNNSSAATQALCNDSSDGVSAVINFSFAVSGGKLAINKAVIAVHDSNDTYLFDVADPSDVGTLSDGASWQLNNITLYSDSFTPYGNGPFQLLAKIQKKDGTWIVLERKTFSLKSCSTTSQTLAQLGFDGSMGCVGYGPNMVFTNMLATIKQGSTGSKIYQLSGKASVKQTATDTTYSATADISGTYDASTEVVALDVAKTSLSTGVHYRTDHCEGPWGSTGMSVDQCTLTYDKGAGCKLWYKMSLHRN